jgi:very-short-patch-repair endonuclease
VRPASTFWFECPIALPAWAVVTAYAERAAPRRDELVYRAIRDRITSVGDIAGVLALMPRVRGRAALERVLASAARGAESHLEGLALRDVFNTGDFVRFVRQHRLRVQGRGFRLDMFDHATLTAVELDGAEIHGAADQREADIRRDAILAGIGIATVRLSYRALTTDPGWCRATVLDVLRARAT